MFKILIKEGVIFREFNSHFVDFIGVLNDVAEKMGFIPTITSAAEGEHTLSSYHVLNCAWDIRTRGLKEVNMVVFNLGKNLEALDRRWEIIYGDKDHLDHIHVEFNLRS